MSEQAELVVEKVVKVRKLNRDISISVNKIIPNDWDYVRIRTLYRNANRVVVEIIKV